MVIGVSAHPETGVNPLGGTVLRRAISLIAVMACGIGAARGQQPPPSDAESYLTSVQAHMLQRVAGAPPFHLRIALTELAPDGSAAATGFYEETWKNEREWKREATLGTKHVAQACHDGERDPAPTTPLDAAGVTLTDLARWALPMFDADAESAVMQNVVSHASGNAIPMKRIGTRMVTEGRGFVPDAEAWYFEASAPTLLGVMDGDYFVEYHDRTALAGRFAPTVWSVAQDTKLFLKANVSQLAAP